MTTPSSTPRKSSAPVTLGDEREQAVVNEASGVGMTAGIYTGVGVAVVAAAVGSLAVPLVILLLTAVPTWVTLLWARRHHVDLAALAESAPRARRATALTVVGLGLLLTLGAMAWTVFTGDGLVTLPTVEVAGPGASGIAASLTRGAVVGVAIGVVIFLVAALLRRPRRTRR